MDSSIKSLILRLMQGCISIATGLWLPQELFIFSKIESKRFEIKCLKNIALVLMLSVVTTFVSIIINIYLSFQTNDSRFASVVNFVISILIYLICVFQAIRYFGKLRIEIGIICLIPIVVSFFILHMPYGKEKFNGNIYVITGYTIVWPLWSCPR